MTTHAPPRSEPVPDRVHALDAAEVLRAVDATDAGLSSTEAARRLGRDGPNELSGRPRASRVEILARQLRNPLIYTLLLSAAVALALGKVTDGFVVLAVVLANALIGFVQEDRAAGAIEALASMVTEPATVLRDGRWHTLPAAELVAGDVVRFQAGDKVDADARLLAAKDLRIDESALTGESLAVEKSASGAAPDAPLAERHSMTYAGTVVRAGTGVAVVTATAGATELGRISALVESAESLETPLTRALGEIASVITKAVAAVAVLLLAVALVRGWSVADAALAAVTLAVAAIPEGLPAIVTIALAVGVQRMARRRAIVRQLPAVETLGSTTVIATDKTGTLTLNAMTVREVWTPAGAKTALLEAAVLCNDADGESGDPTETALLDAAASAGLDPVEVRDASPRLDEIPFASEARRMTTLHEGPHGARFVLVKGAPEVVLPLVPDADRGPAEDAASLLAQGGHRVLAFSRAEVPRDTASLDAVPPLTHRLLGLVAMVDPPRPDAADAVAAVKRAGVQVKMITGDHHATAREIARQVGLRHGRAVTGAELERATDTELSALAADVDVFARVAPEHKLRLVRRLQRDGHVVAMTGDGVNDAPALQQADVGVAMGRRGTSAAREAADLVLADDNFATIRAAVEEGRRVYDNVVKALTFVLPTNLGEALVILAAVCAFPFEAGRPLMPIEPVQILWINLVATVALALPLAFEARDPRLMLRGPRSPRARLIDGPMLRQTTVVALVMAAGAVALFLLERDPGAAPDRAQTLAVTGIAFFQCAYLLACRNPRGRVREIGWFTNPWVYAGIAALLILQATFVYAPFMHTLFGTAPLGVEELAAAALFAASAPIAARAGRTGRRRART